MRPSRTVVGLLLIYGFVLFVFSVLLGGGGHGVFGPLGLAGSPFSLIGFRSRDGYWPAFIAETFQWGLLALMLRWVRVNRTWVGLFLIIHYVVAVVVLAAPSSGYADWEYMDRVTRTSWFVIALGITWYLAGQALLWRMILVRPTPEQAGVDVVSPS